ncbi:MAG: hypothetical protein V4616_02815 [Bacteroidota bacterium]
MNPLLKSGRILLYRKNIFATLLLVLLSAAATAQSGTATVTKQICNADGEVQVTATGFNLPADY